MAVWTSSEQAVIRCSSLPRIWRCPASIKAPEFPVKDGPVHPVTMTGTLVHKALAAILSGQPAPDMTELCADYPDVDAGEVGWLVSSAMRIWDGLKEDLGAYVSDVEGYRQTILSPSHALGGSADVEAHCNNTTGLIVDWKSGYLERDYMEQLRGYAALWQVVAGALSHPMKYERIVLVVAMLRKSETITEIVTDEQTRDWVEELKSRLQDPEETYTSDPGDCTYCPRKAECGFRPLMLADSASALVGLGDGDIMLAEDLAKLYPKAEALKKALAAYSYALKSALEDEGGPLPVGDGTEMYLQEKTRQEVYLESGWPVLNKRLGFDADEPMGAVLDALAPHLKVSKTSLLKALTANAPRGGKSKLREAILAELEDAGALGETQSALLARRTSVEEEREN